MKSKAREQQYYGKPRQTEPNYVSDHTDNKSGDETK